MATQEASGVMVAAILRQQGAMRVSAWESEVTGAMREMVRIVEEGESGL